MSETPILSEEDFARYQKLFNELPQEERFMVVRDLIEQLSQYIHSFISYTRHAEYKGFSRIPDTESILCSFTYRLLEKYDTKVIEPFMKAKAFAQYLKYLQQGISWFVRNKIAKGGRDFPFVQPPIDEDNGQEICIPDDYQPDPIMREIYENLVEFLNKTLTDDQIQLLEMRLGVRFEKKEDGSIQLVDYQKQMTFPQIADELGQTEDAVQKRFTRLIEEIKESPAVILLYRDFAE